MGGGDNIKAKFNKVTLQEETEEEPNVCFFSKKTKKKI